MNQNIAYIGNVRVQYKDKKGRIKEVTAHNAGCSDLFNGFCQLLSGGVGQVSAGSTIRTYLPQSIQLYNDETANTYNEDKKSLKDNVAILYEPKSYTSIPRTFKCTSSNNFKTIDSYEETTEEANMIRFVFTINPNDILSVASPIKSLKLLNSRFNHKDLKTYQRGICAEFDFQKGKEISLRSDSNLIVYWEMIFVNGN